MKEKEIREIIIKNSERNIYGMFTRNYKCNPWKLAKLIKEELDKK